MQRKLSTSRCPNESRFNRGVSFSKTLTHAGHPAGLGPWSRPHHLQCPSLGPPMAHSRTKLQLAEYFMNKAKESCPGPCARLKYLNSFSQLSRIVIIAGADALITDKKPPAFPFLSKVETLTLFLRFASIAVFTVNTTLTTRKIPWEALEVFEVSEAVFHKAREWLTRTWAERAWKSAPLHTEGQCTRQERDVILVGAHKVLPKTPFSSLPQLPPPL